MGKQQTKALKQEIVFWRKMAISGNNVDSLEGPLCAISSNCGQCVIGNRTGPHCEGTPLTEINAHFKGKPLSHGAPDCPICVGLFNEMADFLEEALLEHVIKEEHSD